MYRYNESELSRRQRSRPGFSPIKVCVNIMTEALKIRVNEASRDWPRSEVSARVSELVTRSLVTDAGSGYGIEAAPEIRSISAQLSSIAASPLRQEGELVNFIS